MYQVPPLLKSLLWVPPIHQAIFFYPDIQSPPSSEGPLQSLKKGKEPPNRQIQPEPVSPFHSNPEDRSPGICLYTSNGEFSLSRDGFTSRSGHRILLPVGLGLILGVIPRSTCPPFRMLIFLSVSLSSWVPPNPGHPLLEVVYSVRQFFP